MAALLSLVVAGLALPQSRGEQTLVQQMSASTGLLIDAESLADLHADQDGLVHSFRGYERTVAFLARTDSAAFRDLYIARVRTHEPPAATHQRLIAMTTPVNLTTTEAADEFVLRRHGPWLAVADQTAQRIGAISLFHLHTRNPCRDSEVSSLSCAMMAINDWQKTRRWAGVEKRNIAFQTPVHYLDFDFIADKTRPSFVVEYSAADERRRVAELDLRDAEPQLAGLTVSSEVRLPKAPILWMVDTVRAIPWIGPGPIEWAEGRFFAAKDRYRQLSYRIVGDKGDVDPLGDAPAEVWEPISLPEGLEVGDYDGLVWPPAPLAPVAFKTLATGEGTWSAALPDFVPTLPDAPPAMYRTYLRPDLQRPYVKVTLTAMDTRQLMLHMVGGHEDPRSTTGQVGTGRIPRDPEVLSRVVAAFNGAFKTEHGGYGMMENRTVLLPPLPRGASVVTWDDGRIDMGSWGESADIPDDMVSYRQNMDPLLEDGVVNPRRRYLWGFTLDSDIRNMHTIRSGICVRNDGVLIYAWGEDLTAITLGTAMKGAGCDFGMHLDMNPLHTAFIAYGFDTADFDEKKPQYEAKVLYPGMRYSTHRYVNASPKDFFYVTLRHQRPGPDWTHDEITQPKPAFLPAVHVKRTAHAGAVAVHAHFVGARENDAAVADSDTGNGTGNGTDSDVPVGSQVGANGDDVATATGDDGHGAAAEDEGAALRDLLVAFLPGDTCTDETPRTHGFSLDDRGQLRLHPQPEQRAVGVLFALDAPLPDPEAEVFVIASHGPWLFLAQGQAQEVREILLGAGVTPGEAVALSETAQAAEAWVRTRTGMVDLRGNAVSVRDPRRRAILFLATPTVPFAGIWREN